MIAGYAHCGSAQEVRVYFDETSATFLRLAAVLPMVGDRIVTPDEAGEPRIHVVRDVTTFEDGLTEIRVGFGFPCPQALMATYYVGAAAMMQWDRDDADQSRRDGSSML